MNSHSLNWALRQAARKLSVPVELVEQVYRSYWHFIRETASGLQLKESTEEEFNEKTTNFNVPFIGKLYVDYKQIEKYHNQLNYYKNVRDKKDKADRQPSLGDEEPV